MQRVADASADSLLTFGEWHHAQARLATTGECSLVVASRPRRSCLASTERWLLGTHQGGVSREHQ